MDIETLKSGERVEIRQEPHPIHTGHAIFRAYEMGGWKIRVGGESREEVVSRLNRLLCGS